MLTYFLFLFYLVAGILILHRIVRRKGIPFTVYHTTAAVLFKVMLGCLYGYIFLHHYGGDDTWEYFDKSKAATDVLLKDPFRFIRELLPAYSQKAWPHHVWGALWFYIYHFEYWFMVKFLAVLNLFSGKNYYIDLLWFDLLTLTGSLLLFKMLVSRFPSKKGMYYLLVFFIPSVSFWCSGIRAEALILLFAALILYYGKKYAWRPGWKNASGMLIGITGLLLFRFQFLILFLPALLAYLISLRKKQESPLYFNRIYLVGLILFMASLSLPPSLQLSRPLIQAQRSFFVLKGNTRYSLDSLQPGPVSLLKVLPQAIANSSFRPYPWEGRGILQSLSATESIFLFAAFLFFVLSYSKTQQIQEPLLWLFLYYGITQLIAIGYTVPFPGAIVRYRSIPFLFIFIFLFSPNNILHQKLTDTLFAKH